ncbi:LTA synthase family protein [Cognatiluteimonas weifangensis]|uniref:LTA synthase family protein n=1 Tax=Cognatiluteimonas weifangensis TaxID=2303539 RepID=A0A372DP62_9GAMM|nr:LTA synthase family protein [Luteimonas weifangensis]RFP61197.1 LTA synthase family protein [Luteimonas weifangensis]
MPLRPLAPRYRPLAWLSAVFLAVSALTRLALLLRAGAGVPPTPGHWLAVFGIGLGYDLLTFVYFAWPLVLLLWLLPRRWFAAPLGRWSVALLGGLLVAGCLFIAVAEWTFWEEFQTRFNFIAVDYLVYTTEVIGNIRESYPVPAILTALFVATCIACWRGRRWLLPQADDNMRFGRRGLVTLAWLAATVLGTALVDADMKNRSDNEYVNALAGNGIYQFFAAYRSASIDYARFYRSQPSREAFEGLHTQLQSPDSTFLSDNPYDVTRRIHAHRPLRRLNVVLVSVESLSASFSKGFGGNLDLTPRLDALGRQSLVFDNLYATGTRTVRGLEALSLSVPPTPGESIVKRPHNEDLFSLASVFNRQGYVSEFLYGGYGAFDNMNYFFAHNGYQVRDRESIPDENIHHANIWGVADEDLYTLALAEFDRLQAGGQPFFAHIMTTSNHRPYTFPQGSVDYPQGQRASAVAYTDWALGDFIERARRKPWFTDTVFVITADHCASSGGIATLPTFRYHIPLWIYSPAHIAPAHVARMLSQIDIPPTVLGLLGFDYPSRFYGQDVFALEPGRERAFIGNYQQLGYLRRDRLLELGPNRAVREVLPDYTDDRAQPAVAVDAALEAEAVRYYETASFRFAHGLMGADTADRVATTLLARGEAEAAVAAHGSSR